MLYTFSWFMVILAAYKWLSISEGLKGNFLETMSAQEFSEILLISCHRVFPLSCIGVYNTAFAGFLSLF